MSISTIPFKIRLAIGLGLLVIWGLYVFVIGSTNDNQSPDVDELIRQQEAAFFEEQARLQAQ